MAYSISKRGQKSGSSAGEINMRLKNTEIEAIKKVFLETFIQGEIYLFGSRVDDSQKGGDIDIYITPRSNDNLAQKRIDFLVKLKQIIGLQKIDVVINRGTNRLIDKKAIETGVLLWKN